MPPALDLTHSPCMILLVMECAALVDKEEASNSIVIMNSRLTMMASSTTSSDMMCPPLEVPKSLLEVKLFE